jgi:protein ImuB
MLWVGLHLPLLSLESFAASLPRADDQPLALVDEHIIVAADDTAQALGVAVGQKRATALSLAPQLLLGQADDWRDAQALQAVAHAALAFTPTVCLSGPDGVLLEVQSCLRYFGGLQALVQRLRDTLAPLGHRVHCVSAPTPQGAALLARLHEDLHATEHRLLARALECAPLRVLAAGERHEQLLLGMGLRSIADVRQLPRRGLARRFGEDLLDEMDRAFGDRPDPRQPITPPPAFHGELELFHRADTTDQLLHGAQALLARLVAWLSAQHAFAAGFVLSMKHEPRWRREHTAPVTTLEIALAEPSRDTAHMLTLLRERLGALQLPAPTLELALDAHDIARQPPPNAELFPTPQSERAGLTRLIERLQARLGREQVQSLALVDDHRPERATVVGPADPLRLGRREERALARKAPAGVSPPPDVPDLSSAPEPGDGDDAPELHQPGLLLSRPLWLLATPESLNDRQSRPLFAGRPVQLLCGPERIESGWWDGELAERDYFIGQTAEGALLWLYRGRQVSGEGRWFLHGRFA